MVSVFRVVVACLVLVSGDRSLFGQDDSPVTFATSAVTGVDGRFAIGGFLKDARVTLFATHRDYGRSPAVPVGASEDHATIRLEPPLLLHGIAVDESGAPVQGATVRVTRARHSTLTSYTDQKGRFLFRNAPNARVKIQIDHPGFKVATKKARVPAGKRELDLGTIRLTRGLGIDGRIETADGDALAGVLALQRMRL